MYVVTVLVIGLYMPFPSIYFPAFFLSLQPKPRSIVLWDAVLSSDYDEAMLLVCAGADINALRPNDDKNETLLHFLAKTSTNFNKKSIKLALLLLDYGVNVNAVDATGNSVLHYAIQGNSIELVEKLLSRGTKVDVRNKLDVDVIFDATMNSRRRELLLLILKYDIVDVETRNRRGITALKYLIHRFFDNEDAIRTLLDLGLPVNQTDAETGWTALHYATVMGNLNLVNLLLEYGADVNKKSGVGVSPLCTSCGCRKSYITKVLVEKRANIQECNENDGQYPIHYACSYRSVDNIRFLLQRGANLNVTDEYGATPFSLMKFGAFMESNQIVVKYFAVMSGRKLNVNNNDLDLIYGREDMKEFYQQCLNEVEIMKRMKVIGCISYFNIMDRDLKELAFLTRNEKFVESFDNNDGENLFPLFFVEMDVALKNAVECKNKLKLHEDALRECLLEILPELVLDKIIFYLYINELC